MSVRRAARAFVQPANFADSQTVRVGLECISYMRTEREGRAASSARRDDREYLDGS